MLSTVAASGLLALWGAPPAEASCHIAAFEAQAVTADEGAGTARVTIFLQGGLPQCGGAVKYGTADGSATAPADYQTKEGVVCFTPNDDRKESVDIPVVGDGADEPDESFTVKLEDATEAGCAETAGGVSGNATATVTVRDDDAPAPPAGGPPVPAASSPARTAAPRATPATSPTPTAPPVSAAVEPTPVTTALAVEDTGEETSGRGAVLALAVAAVLIAAAGGFFAWQRLGRSGPG